MATFKELGDKYEPLLESFSNFKIGKTGQTIEERYEEEYSDFYDNYEIVGSSTDETTIDEFEIYMIKRFGDLPNCDNEQVGGGAMIKSNEYIVYLMYNK
ncbi:hypothetical protein INQ51_07295 [Maribellus sp. CM-23]|uniref:hypothetical protein n=1 Tax=Maribellus sp. CM-23 TaxID=2781026 RepID=UPI001F39569C|nr:hypothetical protein [Maribellus sp. CM-23]MCE4564112.1 hypothetical protein [Maribellus sp. CM-23]